MFFGGIGVLFLGGTGGGGWGLAVGELAEVVGGEERGDGEEVVGGEGEYVACHFVDGVNAVVVEVGFADGLHLVEGGVVVDGHLADVLALGGTELGGCEGLGGEAVELAEDEVARVVGGAVVNAGIDVEEASVGEGYVLRLDGVAEAVFLADGDVEARVHGGASDEVVEEREGDLSVVEEVWCLASEEEVGLVGVAGESFMEDVDRWICFF